MSLFDQTSVRNQIAVRETSQRRSRTAFRIASLFSFAPFMALTLALTSIGEAQLRPYKPANEPSRLTPIEQPSSLKGAINQVTRIEDPQIESRNQSHSLKTRNRQILRPVEDRMQPSEWDQPSQSVHGNRLQPIEDALQPEELEEIKRIRQQIGGAVKLETGRPGLYQPFETEDAHFDSALNKLNQLMPRPPVQERDAPGVYAFPQLGTPRRQLGPLRPVHLQDAGLQPDERLPFLPNPKAENRPLSDESAPWHPPSENGSRNALRRVARQLEDLAANLENLQLYDEADNLRDHANRLWKKAR